MFSRSQILAILAGGAGGVIAIAIMETFSARGPNRGDTWPRHLAATLAVTTPELDPTEPPARAAHSAAGRIALWRSRKRPSSGSSARRLR
jgi:hypothetical protein